MTKGFDDEIEELKEHYEIRKHKYRKQNDLRVCESLEDIAEKLKSAQKSVESKSLSDEVKTIYNSHLNEELGKKISEAIK